MEPKLVVEILSDILVPTSIAFVGYWFTRQRDRSDKSKQKAETFSTFLDALSSDNPQKQKYALIALHHLRKEGGFPSSLLDSVDIIASSTNLEVASAAQLVDLVNVKKEDMSLLLELLLPVKIHLNRSKNTFDIWVSSQTQNPSQGIEQMIYKSNVFIRDLLVEKWYLVPEQLKKDALLLINHYNDWIDEYFKLRPDGKRQDSPKYVFVGNFPSGAEFNFLRYYEDLVKKGDD